MIAATVNKFVAPTKSMSWFEAMYLSVLAFGLMVPVVICAYLIKSALGIDLMAGHTPLLHNLFYHFVA